MDELDIKTCVACFLDSDAGPARMAAFVAEVNEFEHQRERKEKFKLFAKRVAFGTVLFVGLQTFIVERFLEKIGFINPNPVTPYFVVDKILQVLGVIDPSSLGAQHAFCVP